MRRPQERKRRHASKKDMEDSRYRLYRSTMPRLTPKMSAAAGPVHEIRAPPLFAKPYPWLKRARI